MLKSIIFKYVLPKLKISCSLSFLISQTDMLIEFGDSFPKPKKTDCETSDPANPSLSLVLLRNFKKCYQNHIITKLPRPSTYISYRTEKKLSNKSLRYILKLHEIHIMQFL